MTPVGTATATLKRATVGSRSAAQRSARMRFAVDQKSWTTCAERHSLQCVDRVSQSLRLRLHDYARIALQECPMLLGGIKGAQEGAH